MRKRDEEGAAAALYAFSRQFGIAFGVGVGGTVFQDVMGLKLEWQGLDPGIAKISATFLAELSRPVDDMIWSQATEAYIFGLRGVYLLFTCISATAFLLSILPEQFQMAESVESQRLTGRFEFWDSFRWAAPNLERQGCKKIKTKYLSPSNEGSE